MRNYDDYNDRIKTMITRLYTPGSPQDFDIKMSTSNIFQDLCNIIPETAIDKYMVMECLEELGFEPGYEQKKITITKDDGEQESRIYDDLTYYWYLKKKL